MGIPAPVKCGLLLQETVKLTMLKDISLYQMGFIIKGPFHLFADQPNDVIYFLEFLFLFIWAHNHKTFDLDWLIEYQ